MELLDKIKDLLLPAISVDISGVRLYEYLKDKGLDTEIIPEGSPDEPRPVPRWWSSLNYSFSIRLKGLNIDVMQINEYKTVQTNEYKIRPGYEHGSYSGSYYYQIDYIVRGLKYEKWHLRRKLKKVKASIAPSVFIGIERRKIKVSTDKKNQCVRIHGPKLPFGKEERIVEKGGKQVKYVFLKNAYFPPMETLEAYNEIALHVRRILESG